MVDASPGRFVRSGTWLVVCLSLGACGEESGDQARTSSAISSPESKRQDPKKEGDQPSKTPDLRQLTTQLRERIDRLADQARLETAGQERIDFSGDITAWAISQAVLPPDEERREAASVHEKLLGKIKVAATPKPAEEVFRRMIAGLPAHQSPREFEWTLTTIEAQDVNAFSVGGGFVYVQQPILDSLLADATRGTGAVAFVLAHEIGHVALGHCRRGYQRQRIEADIGDDITRKTEKELLGKILQTSINEAGKLVKFLYSRDQEYEADLFALHLCRNAGVDQEQMLDGLRWLVMLQHPRVRSEPEFVPGDDEDQSLGSYFLSSHPRMLRRLRRLRMELAGTLPDETSFGLFAWEAGSDKLTKGKEGEIGAGERALVLLHGMGGSEKTFLVFRQMLAKELPLVRVLLFRYPNNGSLAHAAAFLKREIGRVVRSPEQAVFVSHSAGGLVFRAYAEKLGGRFDRAVFLGTPHRGSNLVAAKFLVDLSKFVPALRKGIPEAVDQSILEGEGQISHDLHPDSLFLRWLGDKPPHGDRYHAHAGQYLNKVSRLAMEEGFPIARMAVKPFLEARIRRPVWVREAVLARVEALRLTEEITVGDGVVSVASATAVGTAPKTWPKLHHLSITSDEAVVKEVVELLK